MTEAQFCFLSWKKQKSGERMPCSQGPVLSHLGNQNENHQVSCGHLQEESPHTCAVNSFGGFRIPGYLCALKTYTYVFLGEMSVDSKHCN